MSLNLVLLCSWKQKNLVGGLSKDKFAQVYLEGVYVCMGVLFANYVCSSQQPI